MATSVKKILLRLDGVSSLVGGNLNTLSINGTSVLNPEDTLALGSTLEYTFSGTKTLGVGDPLSLTLSDILTPPTTPGSYLAYLEIQDELGGNTSWTGSYATIGSGDIQVSVGSIREMITLDPIRRLTSSSVYQTG